MANKAVPEDFGLLRDCVVPYDTTWFVPFHCQTEHRGVATVQRYNEQFIVLHRINHAREHVNGLAPFEIGRSISRQ